MSAHTTPLPWKPNRPSLRLRYGVALAIAVHITVLWWWREWRVLDAKPAEPTLRLRLAPFPVRARPAPPVPRIEPRREPIARPAPLEAVREVLPEIASPSSPPGSEVTGTPGALEILSTLQRYRLTSAPLPEEPAPAPRSLARARDVSPPDWLDPALPELPFADTPLDVPFYAFGPKGDLQRLGDALTREFGFRTRYGTEVKCVWMVVVVGCAWD